jgi:hypothetical protein
MNLHKKDPHFHFLPYCVFLPLLTASKPSAKDRLKKSDSGIGPTSSITNPTPFTQVASLHLFDMLNRVTNAHRLPGII